MLSRASQFIWRVAFTLPVFAQLTAAQPALGAKVLIVSSIGVPPYQQAVKGLAEKLLDAGVWPSFLELPPEGNEVLIAAALQNGPRVVVAVGPEARWSLGRTGMRTPAISTMLFLSDLDEEAAQGRPLPTNLVASVYLDAIPDDVAIQLHQALPGVTRVGLIVPSSASAGAWVTALSRAKVSVHVVECKQSADMLKAFLSLRSKVDLVLAIPIPKLYNPGTIEPLLRASLDHHLPVVGYSESFVTAGAMAGIFPSYEDLGSQTADLVLKFISGAKTLEDETPKRLMIKTNPKVLRLMDRSF